MSVEGFKRVSRAYKSIKERANAYDHIDGTVVGSVISFGVIPIQSAVSFGVEKINSGADFEKALAVAALSVTAASIRLDAKTLDEKKHSASPTSNLLHLVLDHSYAASILSHASSVARYVAINPTTAFGLITGNTEILTVGALTTPVVVGAWRLGWNQAIREGKLDPALEKVERVRAAVVTKASSFKESAKRKFRMNKKPQEIEMPIGEVLSVYNPAEE